MRNGTTSRRTWVFAVLMLGASFLTYGLTAKGVGGEETALWIGDFGEAAILVAAAAMTWWAATRYQPHEKLRLRWMLIAAGVTSFAIGDCIWAVLEAGLGRDPYPSIADAFYLPTYAFIGPALLMIALSHRGIIKLAVPAILSGGVAIATALVLYAALLSGILADGGIPPLEKAVSLTYPLADVFLLFGASLFVALVVSRMGTALLARQWWVVLVGAVVVAAADTGMSYLSSIDQYSAGSVLNVGWMAGFALIAVGASVARDVADAFNMPASRDSMIAA